MTNKQKIQIVRVTLLIGAIVSLFFVPWLLVKAWLLPLPDSIQEQLEEQANTLKKQIIGLLAQRRATLNHYLLQSDLAVARLHDESLKIPELD